ncbi:MAG: formate dehydrogenase accessory protein FdhE [Syntrophomonadaceae bacterium]|nr:formate dehydrogenase accessory protein FdhE [Syntrophomonadaceae bacterium]
MKNRLPFVLPEGYVEFYKAVESWQNEFFFKLKRTAGTGEYDADRVPQNIERPVLETHGIDIDPDHYREAFLELTQLVMKEREGIKESLQEIVKVFSEMDFIEVASRVINNDYQHFKNLAAEKGLAGELAYFLLDHALRPFLRCYALPYQEVVGGEDFHWEMAVCPVCGFQVTFSRFRAEDGQRFLFCEHCFTEWPSRYLGCIYCGNAEPLTIKYLVVEGDDAHQLFVCEKCKGYLKTFDERKGDAKRDLFIAGIETVYLDLIAEENGYTNTRTEDERNLN